MSKKMVRYTEGEIGEVEMVQDFLPHPKNLVLKNDAVKVTLSLSKKSIDFFKAQAHIHHVPYQRMIKSLIDEYTAKYSELIKSKAG